MSWKTDFTIAEQREIAAKTTMPRLMSVPLGALGMFTLGEVTFGTHPVVTVALTVFTASMMFCWTSAFHEAAHQTLWRSQALSILSGRILGTLLWVPYTVYRQVHIRHHAFLNRPDDWELWPYTSPRASLAFRRMFAWIDLLGGIFAGPYVYARLYFHADSPLCEPRMRRTIAAEYCAIALVWGAIWTYTTIAGIWPDHLRSIIIPMWMAAMLQTGRKFTEHLGMASYDPIQGTRTVLPNRWLLRLSSFLNFDIFIHGPHHRYPRAAHTTLRAKLDDYRHENETKPNPQVYSSYHQAVRAMLPWLVRNPGCGINVRTDSMGPAVTGSDVDDFSPDATLHPDTTCPVPQQQLVDVEN
jgi:fatty acid desaturase